jgi:hypothetical protein
MAAAKHIITFVVVVYVVSRSYQYATDKFRERALHSSLAIEFFDVYVHHGDFVRDVPFHAGDYMFAHYKVVRHTTCNVSIQWRLIKLGPGEHFIGPASYGYPVFYYGPPISIETNEYLEIPRGMPAGKYDCVVASI